ncbi:DNA-cytosine methyltransferase [hydrothermal vent metagenome]|uniref:DNA-cytosine methyltransferase n=1 Tax=hydrothermal vent metagenome TaxID=652676 RepID=A0A3B0VM56_9ZZZZ
MKFVDFCAGIGGFRLGLEKLGFQNIYSCEINKHCEKTYSLNFGDRFDAKDISFVDPSELPEYDLFCAGFPCQPFSIAGKRQGFFDDRSNVFEQIIRLIEGTSPQVVLLENVKHLLYHDKRRTFKIIINMLAERGYFVRYQVLNSKIFGIPQSRERIFIVGFKSSVAADKFSFPFSDRVEKVLDDILVVGNDEYPLSKKWLEYIELYSGKKSLEEIPFQVPKTRVALENDPDTNLMNCVLQMRSSGIRAIPTNRPFPTFAVSISGGGAMIPIYVRELRHFSLIEMQRLMGFPDSFQFDVARTHAIKQLANAVCPPVVQEIGKQIAKAIETNNIGINSVSKSPQKMYQQQPLLDFS